MNIFIFTRDLRLEDNTGLISALENSGGDVLPIFVLTPEQISDDNKYRSNNCVQFMCESLMELDKDLKKHGSRLFLFYGSHCDVLGKLFTCGTISGVYINIDYTPYAKKRENIIEKLCVKNDVKYVPCEDHMLTGCSKITKSDGLPYVKFTPYYRAACEYIKTNKIAVAKNNHKNYVKNTKRFGGKEYKISKIKEFYVENQDISVHGGRNNALSILRNIKKFSDYNTSRDYVDRDTTHLSAYLKFGVVSIREAYTSFKNGLGNSNKLLTQLYWRDFYMNICHHFPHVIGNSMREKYNGIKWDGKESWFKAWASGNTGIPIIDAGMRQMNKTGWMHGRARMIVSNYLIKVLHIDWKRGEKYFAQNLVDYDVMLNNGNWQWGASTGADSQPYFRIFNPWRQSIKFDPNADYIKKWIPELKDVPVRDIHKWNLTYNNYDVKYMCPILNDSDTKKQLKNTMKMYS